MIITTEEAMAPSDKTGWSQQLANPGGPEGVHEQVFRLTRKEATERPRDAEAFVPGADEAVAAVAVLRGPADCREYVADVTPAFDMIGRKLTVFPQSISNFSILAIMSLTAISECVGAAIRLPAFDLDRKITDLLTAKNLSPNQDATLALVLLGLDRKKDVTLLLAKRKSIVGTFPFKLIAALDSGKEVEAIWESFLREFPSLVNAGKAEWRHLVLAARVVARRRNQPVADVADTLHRRAVELASEAS
jgi:hypothetical protein